MTDRPPITHAAQESRRRKSLLERLRSTAPAFLHVRGLAVELAKCTPEMRDALLAYTSLELQGDNPLARIEAIEEEHIDLAATKLAVTLLAKGQNDEAIEDALCRLREHLGEHFRQRKYDRLYAGR